MQRQYSGTSGRIENCQIGMFLSDASCHGRALLDRELYLPKQWANDPPRCAAAKVLQDVEFATKPQLALRMIEHAVAAQVPFAWITGDEIYGDDRRLRVWLEQSDLHFVLAVASNQSVWATDFRQTGISQLVESMPGLAWHTLSAGDDAKGEVGLDQYEVRNWHGWYRHITLAMLAHAYLAKLSAHTIDDAGVKKRRAHPP